MQHYGGVAVFHYPTVLRNVMPVHYVVHSQVKTFRIPHFALLNGLQRSSLMKITLLRVHTQQLGEWLPDFWGCQVTFFHKRAKEQSGMNSLRKDRLFCNQSTCHPPSVTKTPNASGLLIVIGIRQNVPPSYQCYAWQSRRLPAVTGFKKLKGWHNLYTIPYIHSLLQIWQLCCTSLDVKRKENRV